MLSNVPSVKTDTSCSGKRGGAGWLILAVRPKGKFRSEVVKIGP